MKFDDILTKYVGEFGIYQRVQLILVCLPILCISMHSLSWTFTAAVIPHRCLLADETSNFTQFYPDINKPYVDWLKKWKNWAECERPGNFSLQESRKSVEEIEKSPMEPCLDGDFWDTSQIKSSAVKIWDLKCKREWLKSTVHAFYYIGQFFGSLIFGIIADKYGRKPVFFMAIAIIFTCGTVMAYVPHLALFTFLRFMLGFAHPAIFVTAVVISIEMLGPSYRSLASVLTNAFYAGGQMVLAGLAYKFRYYDQLQLAISVLIAIFVVYWWIVPESARWLVTRKKYHEAEKILQKIAHYNKTSLPEEWSKDLTVDEKDTTPKASAGFLDMFKTPNVRKHSLTLFICWPIVSMAYYGLAMNPNFMGGDPYTPIMISGTLEIFASFFLLSVLNTVGRKFCAVVGFSAAAFFLLASTFIPIYYDTVRMVCVCLGKMCLSAVYAVLYLFTPELFPTVIRMTAVGACSMIARFGGFFASYVFLWMARFYPTLVAIGFSVTCLFAALMLLLLPDTNGQPQIETIDEAEEFAKNNKKLFVFSWDVKKRISEEIEMQKNGTRNRQ